MNTQEDYDDDKDYDYDYEPDPNAYKEERYLERIEKEKTIN
jgi:hypothetical protein